MSAKQTVVDNLVSCRNILLSGHINEHVLPCLEGVLETLESITVSSTRKIIKRCVTEAICRTKSSDFVSAGLILNLIHNLPVDEASQQRWDIDYFLSIELPTFLEHFEEVKSSRMITLYVCQQLAVQYLPDSD